LSVAPVETEFGRKTQIHQSSCNTDYSCLDGDCPSFMTAIPTAAPGATASRAPIDLGALPAPMPTGSTERANLYFMGIGGTGVVTVNQILGTAALLDGKQVRCLDQTGLSQKGGAVVSHLKITAVREETSNKVGVGEADGYIGFDVLTASDPRHLSRARPDRSAAVVSSSHVPTGLMVRNPAVAFPDDAVLHQRIDAVTGAGRGAMYLDAEAIAETLFGSHLQANLVVVGAAYQRGLIPLTAESIEAAIALNGAGVATNQAAFRVGCKVAADPGWLATLSLDRPGALPASPTAVSADDRAAIAAIGATGELARLLEIRVPDLVDYQNRDYADRYLHFVAEVLKRERPLDRGTPVTEAVARSLHKLMAYKDEYEVARLALDPAVDRAVERTFGPGAELSYRLHPPLLRALGMRRKIALGRWFRPVFRLLRALRGLRGGPFDPFGWDDVRRTERRLIAEYRAMMTEAAATLGPDNQLAVAELAALPDMIRGFEDVKRRNVARYREAVAAHRHRTADRPVTV